MRARSSLSAAIFPVAAAATALVAVSCANHVDMTIGPPAGVPISFSSDVQKIFDRNCALAFCHTAPLGFPMDLSQGNAYASIHNVPSLELPAMDRVEPGTPDLSYLVHKIQGTQAQVMGSGQQMPIGGQLPQAEIDVIRSWIEQGALDN